MMSTQTEDSWPGLISLLPWVSSLGKRYSLKNGFWEPEAIAEAQCLAVDFWASDLYKQVGESKGHIHRYIMRGLVEYFKGYSKKRRSIKFMELLNEPTVTESLIDLISEHVDDPFAFLRLIEEGLDVEDIMFLSNEIEVGKKISRIVSQRLRQLGVARNAGVSPVPGLPEIGQSP